MNRPKSKMRSDVEFMASFVLSLKNHYRAAETSVNGHRYFVNVWGMSEDGGFIIIRKSDGQIRFGKSVTQSTPMSESMQIAIARRTYALPGASLPAPQRGLGPVGR